MGRGGRRLAEAVKLRGGPPLSYAGCGEMLRERFPPSTSNALILPGRRYHRPGDAFGLPEDYMSALKRTRSFSPPPHLRSIGFHRQQWVPPQAVRPLPASSQGLANDSPAYSTAWWSLFVASPGWGSGHRHQIAHSPACARGRNGEGTFRPSPYPRFRRPGSRMGHGQEHVILVTGRVHKLTCAPRAISFGACLHRGPGMAPE